MQSNEKISKTGIQRQGCEQYTLCLLDGRDTVGANDAEQPLQAMVLCLHHGAKWLFPSLTPNMEMRYSNEIASRIIVFKVYFIMFHDVTVASTLQ